MESNNKYLGKERISKLLLKFSIPCILSLLISSLYNIVDQIFIGNSELGYLGNAATSIVFPITIIFVAFAWAIGDGGAADYVLRNNKKIIRIFIYAPLEYRIKSVMEMYHDKKEDAKKNIKKSDKNRASYYKLISGNTFGDVNNYDLCIDSSIGVENTANLICEFINNRK